MICIILMSVQVGVHICILIIEILPGRMADNTSCTEHHQRDSNKNENSNRISSNKHNDSSMPAQPSGVCGNYSNQRGCVVFSMNSLLFKSRNCLSPIISRQLVLRVKEQGLLQHTPLAGFIMFCLTLSALN